MNISISPKLKEYMHKKGYVAITVGLAESSTCCSGFAEVATGFVNERGFASAAKQAKAQLQADAITVFVVSRGLEFDDTLAFDLKTFLGVKDIAVSGVKAFSL